LPVLPRLFQILCPTLFMLASYALSGQPQEGSRIIRLWSICILLAFLGQLLGYVFGAAFGAQVTQLCNLINKILDLLGLRKAEDTSVGKLSGGEKKRLSIGVELITNPPVMFFDEPTSGLDSSSSLQVISHLKSLAQGGRTVVCTIHQPSSRLFEMFDDLYILAEGQCLYNGPVREMTAVFEEAGFPCPEHHNRADFGEQHV
ncbi:hypothetical protein ANN_25424, partial [Periplaneta americana]